VMNELILSIIILDIPEVFSIFNSSNRLCSIHDPSQ
jgi:hypothetical protein